MRNFGGLHINYRSIIGDFPFDVTQCFGIWAKVLGSQCADDIS